MIEMPGFTFTLPEDLVAEGINAAGWARVDYNKGWARIWLYDPSTDLIAQLPHPGFFEITFMSNDMTVDEYAAENVNSSDGTYNADLFKDVMVDLGSNNTFHYYVMDYGKLEELAPGSMQGTEDGYLQRGIDQARIDKAKELNARLEELKSCFQPTDLTVPKVQTAADIDTSKLANLTLQDLDGNQVKLGDIFAKNKVTMVDMWNTTCTVCVEDMPKLEKY